MADETSWAVALWVKYGRTEAILLSSRYAARHTLLMCCCTDSVWSRWTPRFLTLNGMRLPLMSTLSLPAELRREVDAMGRTSVFSAFSLSLLLYIQPTDFQRRSGYHREAAEIDREGPLWQLGIISVFVIITLVATYQVREGLRVQLMWTGLAQGPNSVEPRTEGGWERTRRCQLSQTAVHGPLNRMQTSEVQCHRKCQM